MESILQLMRPITFVILPYSSATVLSYPDSDLLPCGRPSLSSFTIENASIKIQAQLIL